MKGVSRMIFTIKYSYTGTSKKGKIIKYSSSRPGVVISPHYRVSSTPKLLVTEIMPVRIRETIIVRKW